MVSSTASAGQGATCASSPTIYNWCYYVSFHSVTIHPHSSPSPWGAWCYEAARLRGKWSGLSWARLRRSPSEHCLWDSCWWLLYCTCSHIRQIFRKVTLILWTRYLLPGPWNRLDFRVSPTHLEIVFLLWIFSGSPAILDGQAYALAPTLWTSIGLLQRVLPVWHMIGHIGHPLDKITSFQSLLWAF